MEDWIQDSENPETGLEKWHRETQLRNDSVTSTFNALNRTQPQTTAESSSPSSLLDPGLGPVSYDLQSPPEMLDGETFWADVQSKSLRSDKRPDLVASGPSWVQQNGQVTPPDDWSLGLSYADESFPPAPTAVMGTGVGGEADKDESAENADRPGTSDGASKSQQKRKRSNRRSSSTDEVAPPAKSTRSRRAKGKRTEESDPKRQEFLARNRLAASKSRQKKKEWTSQLESRCRDLQAERSHLAFFIAGLKEEIILLKTEMLKHSSCNCVGIRNYLAQSANALSPLVQDSSLTQPIRSPTGEGSSAGHGSLSSSAGELSPPFRRLSESTHSSTSEQAEPFEGNPGIAAGAEDEDEKMLESINFEDEPDMDAIWGESIDEEAGLNAD